MTTDEKLIYIFLWANPKCTESGIYSVSLKHISEQTGISKERTEKAIYGLNNTHKKISVDGCILFVHGFLKRNFKGAPDLLGKSIIKDANNYRSALCWKKFLQIYKNHIVSKVIANTLQSLYKDLNDMNMNNDNDIDMKEGGVGETKPEEKNWRNDYETYRKECEAGFDLLYNDWKWIANMRTFYPGVSIQRTLDKMFQQYWGEPVGWKNKKSRKSKELDWKATIENTFKINRVFWCKGEIDTELTHLRAQGLV